MSQINVVPYIDVMLVLLIIFMVTAPMIQTASINLPSVGQAARPPAAPIEIIVRADASLALRDRSRGNTEQRIEREDMLNHIRQAQSDNPQQPILIAGDKQARYEAILDVMDALQRNQITHIGLLVKSQTQTTPAQDHRSANQP